MAPPRDVAGIGVIAASIQRLGDLFIECGLSVPTILISYRREDTAAYAGRLADRLKAHFGRDNVFVDIDTIQPARTLSKPSSSRCARPR